MAIRRYSSSNLVNGGLARGSSSAPDTIFKGIESGRISITNRTMQEGERLDIIAAQVYGDATLWWVIAAASGIGWGMQVPPGTNLVIPSLNDISKVI